MVDKFNGLRDLQSLRSIVAPIWEADFGNAKWPYPSESQSSNDVQTIYEGIIDSYDCTVTTQTLPHEKNHQRQAFSFSFTKPGAISLKTQGHLSANENLPSNAPFFLYFTSGGFILDCSKHEAKLMEKISSDSNSRVFSIKYPLAPEHSIEDIMIAAKLTYLWIKENAALLNKDEGSPFIMGGFSAGAGLAINLAAQETNNKYIDKLMLASPFTGLSEEHLEMCSNDDTGLTKKDLENCARHCIGLTSAKDPQLFPAYRENLVLPPTVLLAGERDLLRPFTEFLRDKISNENDVTYKTVMSTDPSKVAEHTHFAWGYANTAMVEMISEVSAKNTLHQMQRRKPTLTPAQDVHKVASVEPTITSATTQNKRKAEP